MTAKSLLLRPQGLRFGARAPTCYATVVKRSVYVYYLCVKRSYMMYNVRFCKAFIYTCSVYLRSLFIQVCAAVSAIADAF